jgi:DNA-binding PadR family transcriptional regulator
MRVRDALLALLASGPSHGYQLKVDYERLTGAGPINVGQVYSTLDRLSRDGLVERAEADGDDRRVPYYLTDVGRTEAVAWLLDPSEPALNGRSVIAGKVLLATRVPGVVIAEVIDAHRLALMTAVGVTRRRSRGQDLDVEARLVLEAELAVAEAELRWLDLCDAEFRDVRATEGTR